MGSKYFDNVPTAMNTLLVDGVLPDTSQIVHDLTEASPYYWPIIMAFVALASLTLMFMLIGVLVDVIGNVASTEKEAMTVSALAGELRSAMASLERDVNQPLLKEDFQKLLIEHDIVRIIQQVGVDVML